MSTSEAGSEDVLRGRIAALLLQDHLEAVRCPRSTGPQPLPREPNVSRLYYCSLARPSIDEAYLDGSGRVPRNLQKWGPLVGVDHGSSTSPTTRERFFILPRAAAPRVPPAPAWRSGGALRATAEAAEIIASHRAPTARGTLKGFARPGPVSSSLLLDSPTPLAKENGRSVASFTSAAVGSAAAVGARVWGRVACAISACGGERARGCRRPRPPAYTTGAASNDHPPDPPRDSARAAAPDSDPRLPDQDRHTAVFGHTEHPRGFRAERARIA